MPSITRDGILTSKSQGRMRVVWVHSLAKRDWAFLHVVNRHGGRVEDVVSVEIDIPDELLVRTAVIGLFYVRVDIAPEHFRRRVGFSVVSESPLGGK
jgi:hypothetical protein